MTRHEKSSRSRRIVMLLMAAAVLVPSLFGFGTKFLEFIALYRGDVEGVFAISPILNYLLASLGFLFLFGWAALGGMFRDIEEPKYTMLENEALLDRVDNDAPGAQFHSPFDGNAMRGHGPAAPRTQRF